MRMRRFCQLRCSDEDTAAGTCSKANSVWGEGGGGGPTHACGHYHKNRLQRFRKEADEGTPLFLFQETVEALARGMDGLNRTLSENEAWLRSRAKDIDALNERIPSTLQGDVFHPHATLAHSNVPGIAAHDLISLSGEVLHVCSDVKICQPQLCGVRGLQKRLGHSQHTLPCGPRVVGVYRMQTISLHILGSLR